MSIQIPKYDFNNPLKLEFELTTISAIYKKSKQKLSLPHKQDFFGLFLFTNSIGKHFVDFKEYEIKKDAVFFISNEQVHYFKEIEETTGNVILFTNSFLENDFLIEQIFERKIGQPVLYLNTDLRLKIEVLISQIQTVISSKNKFSSLLLKNYLEIILLEILQFNSENSSLHDINHKRFIQFKKDLKENYKTNKNVPFFAEKQLISAKTLNTATRKTINKSAKQFISDYIILLAKRMLVNSSFTTTEISFQLGFDEPTNFTKFFKNKENISPKKFQKEHQKSI